MSVYARTLHEELTKLLMDNGASVSKPSIDALIKFIASRDQEITNAIIQDVEEVSRRLQEGTKQWQSN